MSETRFWTTEYTRANVGKSVVGINCPFCDCVTEAYVWSLAGSGKKCDCGAKFVWRPQVATKDKP